MQATKKCFKCDAYKTLNQFYKHPQMPDGHVNKCKECNKKDVKENRLDKIDYYLEYDRGRSNRPDRVEARIKYAKTNEGNISGNRAKKNWCEKNLIKRSASIIVNNAVRDGKLIKIYICQSCGVDNKRIHGHHDNYIYPLSVRWLCSKCHCSWHKKNGEGYKL